MGCKSNQSPRGCCSIGKWFDALTYETATVSGASLFRLGSAEPSAWNRSRALNGRTSEGRQFGEGCSEDEFKELGPDETSSVHR